MIRETHRVPDNGWRFDWVDDRGNEFKGLRFYPQNSVLTSWSRRPHRAAIDNFHPYVINAGDWEHIKQACIQRWGKDDNIAKVANEPVEQPKVKMAYYEPAFGPKWVNYEKHSALIERNLAHWEANGLLIEYR